MMDDTQVPYNSAGEVTLRHVPLLESLERQRAAAQQRLDDLDKAIAAVRANPGVQAVLDAITKASVRF